LEVSDPLGKTLASLPITDPYKEIYLEREKWWGLIREDWLRPERGTPISWDIFAMNIGFAKDFHRSLAGKYHHKTYVFYGGGNAKESFTKIRWKIAHGTLPNGAGTRPVLADVLNMAHRDVRTDGSNNLYVGGERTIKTTSRADAPVAIAVEASHWEVRCETHDGPGDGTVPVRSGEDPRKRGGASILQQFALSGVQHEPAYRDYPIAQQVAYYAITKLAALVDFK
jgi:hypothetical protein